MTSPSGSVSVLFATDAGISNFIGSTAGMRAPYADSQNLSVSLGYYNEPVHIRVAKSIVGNSSGGGAYLFSPAGYDVNYLVDAFLDSLKTGNFTTSSLRAQDL